MFLLIMNEEYMPNGNTETVNMTQNMLGQGLQLLIKLKRRRGLHKICKKN